MKADNFTCPTDLIAGLDNLERKIIAGDDLSPHLSKSVSKNYEGTDDLLNDWGIHHLHLGIVMENGFVKRTKPVLFCKVTENVIYFIVVKLHGEWTEQSLLTTVYRNWPDLIKPFIIPGAVSVYNKQTNEDIKKLRKGHANHSVELQPGTVIYPPGGGYATDGTSNEVVNEVFKRLRILTEFEERKKENESNIRRRIIAKKKTPARTLKFKLEIKGDSPFAYEIYSKEVFSLSDHFFEYISD